MPGPFERREGKQGDISRTPVLPHGHSCTLISSCLIAAGPSQGGSAFASRARIGHPAPDIGQTPLPEFASQVS